MLDLQVDLNAALVAVKKKCVDLDESVKNEDSKPQNRGRGYLGVKRYIYALTTRNKENSLSRRGRSLTRVYVEQKFYRSQSVPSPDQVHRLEDCTQDFTPSGEERLEYTETIDAPLEELIKEDQSHQYIVSQRLPQGHAEWDHELAVYEEDGLSGLLEDRTLTVRAGDHPFGMNQFNEVAESVSSRIAEFFGQKTHEERNLIRTRELSLSVHPVYHGANGEAYTSFGMSRSKSMGSVHQEAHSSPSPSKPRLDAISKTTNSLSNLYLVQDQHDYDSKYGHYISGHGRFGAYGETIPPPANPEVMPKMPKKVEEHVYAEPVFNRRDTVIFVPPVVVPAPIAPAPIAPASVVPALEKTDYSSIYTSTRHESLYERKYDFINTFPPEVEMPDGYHSYYDPANFMHRDTYYQGNLTRPLHYSYGRDYLEKYSDYDGTSRRQTPSPLPPPVEPEPESIKYIALSYTHDLPHNAFHTTASYPDYYDASSRIILQKDQEHEHLALNLQLQHPDYYDHAARILLNYSHDLPHEPIHIAQFPEYYDLATRYQELHYSHDLPHTVLVIENPYEEQEIIVDFHEEKPVYDEVYVPQKEEEEEIYDEIYEPPVLPPTPPPPPPPIVMEYTHDLAWIPYIPDIPSYPPPAPPAPPVIEEIHIAKPVVVVPEPEPEPTPAVRHYDEIYIGREALDVLVSPTFNQTNDQKNLGLEKSVHDRVREMEETLRGEDRKRMEEEEKRRRYEERQAEIREARLLELEEEEKERNASYNAYESKDTPAPIQQPIYIPDVFTIPAHEEHAIPEKPKRTWVPPPKEELVLDEHEDKPLGPVIFHELIYQQGILRQKYTEEQRATARPVSRPVSRANSRPSTPGPEFRSIDFPRLDEQQGHVDATVDYVQKHIERYNAYGAATEDSQLENRAHTHVHTVSAEQHQEHHNEIEQVHEYKEHHHHHHHKEHKEHKKHKEHKEHKEHRHHHHKEKRESVVYDEPSREVVYDVPHDQAHHHHSKHQETVHYDSVTSQIDEEEQLKLQRHAIELEYQLAQTNLAIRQMSKSNKWAASSEVTSSETSKTVLHHSNSLNRQNIPPPLEIQDSNETSHHEHHHHHHHHHQEHHVHYIDENENTQAPKSADYSSVSVGHVKNLAMKFNKVDEKPISTEQVIYRVRAPPPGHHLHQEITSPTSTITSHTTTSTIIEPRRPRSLPRIPMDEVTLHERGGRDHLTKSHQEHHPHRIGEGVVATTVVLPPKESPRTLHNSHYHHINNNDEPTVRVRRVYKANENSSMLSPVSMPAIDDVFEITH